MYKILRLSLIGLFTLLTGTLMAQKTVTIDFDNDYQTLFPTLSGVSSNDSHDGDFTEATTSTLVDNAVMVIVSPAEDAKTPSRIWSSAPRLRMYSGQFTVYANDPITKIEFTGHSTNFNLTPLSGTLEGKTWTGNDNVVIFNVEKNTQINKIVITMGGSEIDPGDDDDGYDITSGQISESENQIVFDFVGTDTKNEVSITGKMVFDFADNVCINSTIEVTYPTVEMAQAGYNDALADAEEDGYTDVKLDGKTVSANTTGIYAGMPKAIIKYMLSILMDENPFTGDGTLANPFNATDAIVIGFMQEPGVTNEVSFYIKGKISSIKYPFDTQYGTATFFISEDGSKTSDQFQVYGAYYLENKPWTDGYTQIKEGDDVIIYGKLTNYNGTPETASKQAYIYSLNGVTKAEGTTPNPIQLIKVEKALEIANALEDNQTTAETYQVEGFVTSITEISTSYGNATFVLSSSDTVDTGLTVFRAKGFDNQSITDENIIKKLDYVVVEGKLKKYVKNGEATPELVNGHIVSINGEGSGISDVEADTESTMIYTLSGQRVKNAQHGIYIINGKKVVVK